MRDSLKRMSIVPFEMTIAAFAIVSGFAGLFHLGAVDPINSLLPVWEATIFNILFIVCGFLLTAGVAFSRAGVEGLGLWILNGLVLSRFILYGNVLGYGKNFIVTGLFDIIIMLASFTRLQSIRKRQILVKVSNGHTLDTIDDK